MKRIRKLLEFGRTVRKKFPDDLIATSFTKTLLSADVVGYTDDLPSGLLRAISQ
jgi:hypothetical protein